MTNSITKGRIVTQDMGVYDGVHSTVGRRDSSGGTVSGLAIGAVVDVLAAYGNHEDYSQAAIGRAVNAIGSKNRTLVFRPGTWKITSNLTIASNFSIYMPAGAVFDVSAGVTLTVAGSFFNDHATYSSGSGTVTQSGGTSFPGNVDIVDHDASTTGLKLGGTLVTASAAEINKLDGVTANTAEINLLAGAGTAPTNHTDVAIRTYFYNGTADRGSLDVENAMSEDTFESVGPTGSGATNIWTALDNMSSSAKAVIVLVHMDMVQTGLADAEMRAFARPGNVSWGVGIDTEIARIGIPDNGAADDWSLSVQASIPLDQSDRTFDIAWQESNTTSSRTINLYYVGFMD